MIKTPQATRPTPAMQTGPSSPHKLVFATQDVSDAELKLLGQWGCAPERADTAHLGDVLKQSGDEIALFWNIPTEAMSAVLLGDGDPEQVVAEWVSRHGGLLSLVRRHRRKLRLIDSRLLTPLASQHDTERLASWLGLEIEPSEIVEFSETSDSAARLLASLMLARLQEMRVCLDELEASSLTLASDALPPALLNASRAGFDELRQLRTECNDHREAIERHKAEQTETAAAARKQSQEISLLRSQLAQGQTDAEQALSEQAKRGQLEVDAVRTELRKEKQSFEVLQQQQEDQIGRLKEEMGLLNAQIGLQLEEMAHQQDEAARIEARRNETAQENERSLARALIDFRREARERKTLQDRLQEAEERLAAIQAERDLLNQNISDIYASRSWRVTRPMRQFRLAVAPIREDDTAIDR